MKISQELLPILYLKPILNDSLFQITSEKGFLKNNSEWLHFYDFFFRKYLLIDLDWSIMNSILLFKLNFFLPNRFEIRLLWSEENRKIYNDPMFVELGTTLITPYIYLKKWSLKAVQINIYDFIYLYTHVCVCESLYL